MSLHDRQLEHMQGCTDNGVIPQSETSTNLTLMHSVDLEYTHNNRIKGLPVVSDDDLNSGRVKYPRTTLIGPGVSNHTKDQRFPYRFL